MQQCMRKDLYRSKSCARIVALYKNLVVKYRRNLCKSLTYIASPLQQSCSESIGILQKLVQESNMLALHCKLTSVCINCCREYLARRMHQWSYIIYACKVASFCKINNFLHAHAKTTCKISTHSFKILLHSSLSILVHMHGGSIHSL